MLDSSSLIGSGIQPQQQQQAQLPLTILYSEIVHAVYNMATNTLESYQLLGTVSVESTIPKAELVQQNCTNGGKRVYAFNVHMLNTQGIANPKTSAYAKQISHPDASADSSMILKCKLTSDQLQNGEACLLKFNLQQSQRPVPMKITVMNRVTQSSFDMLWQYAINPALFSGLKPLQKLSFFMQPVLGEGKQVEQVQVKPDAAAKQIQFSKDKQYIEWSVLDAKPPSADAPHDCKIMLQCSLKGNAPPAPNTQPGKLMCLFENNCVATGDNADKLVTLSGISFDGCGNNKSKLYGQQFMGGVKHKLTSGIF